MSGEKVWERLRQARHAVLTNNQAQTLAQSKAVVDAHHTMAFRAAGVEFKPVEDMINVGDTTHIHHAAPVAPTSAAGTIAKLAIAAGLLATGVGLPAAGWLVADAIRNRPTPPAVQDTDTDTDSWLDIELVPNQ